MIGPSITPDDFARQLTLEELADATNNSAPTRRIVICSLAISDFGRLEQELGEVRASTLIRELSVFVRRNLRGNDCLAVARNELLLLMDDGTNSSEAVARRIISAVRSHNFTSLGADHPRRMMVSIGLAASPQHGVSFGALVTSARAARPSGGDGLATAFDDTDPLPDLSRFVGRSEPLAQLSRLLEDTARGVGRVVAVIGERGAGKSTLVRTLSPEVRVHGGSLVCASSREPTFVAPYALWIEVLRGIRRLPVKSTRLWRELHALDPALERGPSAGAMGSKTLLLEELADYLRLVAQQRPLVLLLENLQWADASSWDALEYVTTQLESERILIALTLQSGGGEEALERWERLSTRPRHSEIRLSHLTRDDVKRWLEVVMSSSDISRDFLTYVYRQTEGNPLALTALLRDLQESSHLVRDGDVWHASPAVELPLQSKLDDLLARRIARLPHDAQRVLQIAALLGRDIEESFVLSGAFDITDGKGAISLLVDRGMLTRTYERSGAVYVIANVELVSAVARRIDMRTRAALHGQVARLLAMSGDTVLAEVAWHFECAGDHARAYQYALRAANIALQAQDTGSAADLLAAAVRNAPTDRERAEVRVRLARVAEEAGRYEEAEELCDLALQWYDAQPDNVEAITLKRTRALVRMKRGTGARETLEVLHSLETDASRAGADMERASILLLIAQMQWRLGDMRAAQRVAEEAVEIARRGDDELLLADACNRLAVTLQLENPPRARELFVQALDIATARGDTYRRVRGLNNIGILETFCSNADEAWRVLKIAVDQARTANLVESWGRAELNLGVLAGRIGDYDEAARAFSEALRLTSMVQNSEEQLYATYNLAHLERDNDRSREAIDTYELVVDLAERIGQVLIQAGAFGGLGLCRYRVGDLAGAQLAMQRADVLCERIGAWFEGRELIEALKLQFMLKDGQQDAALSLFQESLSLTEGSDISGTIWLVAELGSLFAAFAPALIAETVERYHDHPEVLANPRLRKQFAELRESALPIEPN